MDKPIIASPQVTQHILNRFKLRADKKLGQNFLIDENVVHQIVAAAELSEADTVLEVGPGIGTLTQGLAESKARVVAVELDTRLLPVLATTLNGYDNVRVVHGDILKVNIMEEVGAPSFKVCANLPYYITSPIVMHLLESRLPFGSITVMVQKEAAERLCAEIPGRAVGAVTLAAAYYAEREILFSVPRGSFTPSPNVDSAVIRFTLRGGPAVAVQDERLLFRLIRGAFEHRRKTLVNSVSSAGVCAKEILLAGLERLGIAATVRAEELTLEQFAALANAIDDVRA